MALLMLYSYSGPILMYNEFEKKCKALNLWLIHEFENNRKSLINVASEARYFYKSSSKMPKLVKFVNFWWPCLEVKQCYQVNFNRKNSGEKCPNFKIQMRHIWVIFKQCVPDFWLIFHSWQISQKSPDIKLEIAAQNPPKKGVGKIRYKKTAFNTGIEM